MKLTRFFFAFFFISP
ncbi:hypothetical protein D0X25_22115 [Salmonella enterica subsp. enterica serovar Kentucky]|uniref:Uncharacterized protein n=3 Tax=Salmonella enterica TaxID=28901 RepID=A0A620D658_SALER|nr:pheA operon leader peptide PheL [Salmonella enterica]EAB6786782.1 hypothetical protein [Salmonella enterica subsp. enterica]EBK1668153.1 hypothetical protein [Salmonella enterica subsp. enterica serovar Newport]EBL6043498.1 hypothetical protein [Salmonella enterica subsp. enterica serovar Heidelberg]EBW0393189.1 hypothetical protein [Salmonella enterica subsp. enterica serovar Enteritidis]EBW1470937.1 hypothetical protein [Salmonella enterica subsp. enterica serovar Typhimurium]ECI2205605.